MDSALSKTKQVEWESRLGLRGSSMFFSAYRLVWRGTLGFIALLVSALIAEAANHPGVAVGIFAPSLAVYVLAGAFSIRAISRASHEIYRFNGLDPRLVRKLSKRQLFDPEAFDTWLGTERSAGHAVMG